MIRFADLFSGIGGFRLGIERASGKLGIKTECVFSSEIEKNARKIYEKNFGDIPAGDITSVPADEMPEIDLLCGGFPCQSFSIAGKRKGFGDTRGTLFFEIARICKEKRPKIVFLENVKGLLSHDSGKTFGVILRVLDELGYYAEWHMLNSKDFGVPQNRERVFVIGHLRGSRESRFQVFPIGEDNKWVDEGERKTTNVRTLTAGGHSCGMDPTMTLISEPIAICDSGKSRKLQLQTDFLPPLRNGGGGCGQNINVVIPVMTVNRNEKSQNGRRFKDAGDPMYTLTSQDQHGVLINNSKIRKLTPIECERLQGFPDNWTSGVSDSARYKCLGNAVTVNVIEAIAIKILNGMCVKNERTFHPQIQK